MKREALPQHQNAWHYACNNCKEFISVYLIHNSLGAVVAYMCLFSSILTVTNGEEIGTSVL